LFFERILRYGLASVLQSWKEVRNFLNSLGEHGVRGTKAKVMEIIWGAINIKSYYPKNF
jgi:hypothetical protein